MEILKNIGFGGKDIVNGQIKSKMIKDLGGKQFVITGILTYRKEEVDKDTGEIKNITIGVVKTDKEEFIASTSTTTLESLDILLSVYSEEDIKKGIKVEVIVQKSAKNRDFFSLGIV